MITEVGKSKICRNNVPIHCLKARNCCRTTNINQYLIRQKELMFQYEDIGQKISPLLVRKVSLLFSSGLQLVGWGPPTLGSAICFPQSSIQMLISSRYTLNSQNNVWLNIWAPCGPVKLTHQISHYRAYVVQMSDWPRVPQLPCVRTWHRAQVFQLLV